jgi:hypothetical protein
MKPEIHLCNKSVCVCEGLSLFLISKPSAVPHRTQILQQMTLAHNEVAMSHDVDVVLSDVCEENAVLWNYRYFCT